ncbi:MAG: hypothetical protein KGJ09_03015 [Candidatus Omnitrophica bacterium]|nr:hypothetical protein [Candidatus Omnitrophota bacterium]MDE2009032.1 hypothetical protein [Candidatus Omnitrophota bacterium]MDE2215466.1 hypothetical protein [Candidatus Omnitrophota bacterium]MDE2230874.1 hypothetical protein [Candidatus Omnitrophota bacterium]
MRRIALIGLTVIALVFLNGSVLVWAQQTAKVTGEVVDTYCFVTMGARGEGHRQCGLGCAHKGIPVGIVENGTNKLYVLLPNKNDTSLSKDVINKMGRTATVTGKVYANGGSQFLTVESVS